MNTFAELWNNQLSTNLAKINFNSTIAYGFTEEDKPRGVIIVENGKVVSSGSYKDEKCNWDLRAKEKHWNQWLKEGISTTSLAWAFASNKLDFVCGDFKAMMTDPSMVGPFVDSFALMGKVEQI